MSYDFDVQGIKQIFFKKFLKQTRNRVLLRAKNDNRRKLYAVSTSTLSGDGREARKSRNVSRANRRKPKVDC